MRKYIIWSPPYSRLSGGITVLHRLCHELNQREGVKAYIATNEVNPLWNTPTTIGMTPDRENDIAIYPEVVDGNPFNVNTVIRYVLNNAGKIGGPRTYPGGTIIYAFSELFNDFNLSKEHILWLPALDTDTFFDQHLPRKGAVYYGGKGGVKNIPEIAEAQRLTHDTTHDQKNLAHIFNQAELFYCFDNITAMTDLARMCGCPTIIIPNGEYTKERYLQHETGWEGLGWGVEETENARATMDSTAVRERYLGLHVTFQERLTLLIEETQK